MFYTVFSYSARGDFSAVQDYSVQSQSELVNFVSDAKPLLFSATERNKVFQTNLVGSTIGTAAVLIGSFGLWVFLKKKYEKAEAYESESPRV